MTTTAGETALMFTAEAWEAGWQAAERAGLAQSFQPLMRPISRDDIAAIVSAVANHGFTEMHIDAMISDTEVDRAVADPMPPLRESMRNRLAMLVLREQCVMLTLPREITDRHEPGVIRVRLIVPVRRIGERPRRRRIMADAPGKSTPWHLCPNEPRCPHARIFHDVEDFDDPLPRCCAEGCDCGRKPDPSPAPGPSASL